MKKVLIVILIISFKLNAQVKVPFTSPFITNVPSSVGSAASTANYAVLNITENLIKKTSKSYASNYNKRMMYYAGGLIMKKINIQLKKSEQRLDLLKERNEELLNFKYYSRKQKNKKLLKESKEKIKLLRKELLDQHKITILGEKANLYQNTMRTLTPINRKLDSIENNIIKSNRFKRLIKLMKDEI